MNRLALFLLLFALPLAAQTASDDLKGVQDNSFLIEEAYNQDPNVVQHIGTFMRTGSEQWELAFAEEWPLHGLRHQISYEIPVEHDGETNLGDVELTYRYQLVGDADTDLAIAPRLTLILPTGENSDTGVSIGLPISRVLTPRLAWHTNVDLTWQNDTDLSLGQSLVYALSGRVHLQLEATYSDSELLVAPGVRWAYNRPSGLQIVPGVAAVFGDDNAVLLYLSFEHPFRR